MKLKKLGLIALSVTSLFAMSACGGASNTESYPEVIDIARDSQYKEVYSSFNINTDNVKKVFYLGDKFETTGMVVTKNYLSYDSNNKLVDIPAKQYETKEYSVDSSEVDMNTVGTYPVYVTRRVGTITNTLTYNITVKSSLFESTPNIEYISGIDVTYTDGTALKTYTKNDQIGLTEASLSVAVHKKTIGANLEQTDSVINHDVSKLSYDLSAIDSSKVGSQMIKVTYDGGQVTINGKQYENKVTSYVLVNVKNDALKISAVEGNNNEFKASLEDLDFSSWKIKIDREVGYDIVDFSTDLFIVDDFDPFLWGATQPVTVKLVENPNIKFYPNIYIDESTDLDIVKYTDLMPKGVTTTTDGKKYVYTNLETEADGTIALGGTDFIFGPNSAKTTDAEKVTELEKLYVPRTSDVYGSMQFGTRISIKGSSQPIKIVMDKPGNIVVFFATTGDEERDISFLNGSKEEIAAATSTSKKQEICKAIFTCDKAGTYYVVNPAGGIYVHGFVIAKSK